MRLQLSPTGAGTDVTWTMHGEHVGVMGLMSRVMPLDKMLGKDFEKGLARLKAVAEQSARGRPGMAVPRVSRHRPPVTAAPRTVVVIRGGAVVRDGTWLGG